MVVVVVSPFSGPLPLLWTGRVRYLLLFGFDTRRGQPVESLALRQGCKTSGHLVSKKSSRSFRMKLSRLSKSMAGLMERPERSRVRGGKTRIRRPAARDWVPGYRATAPCPPSLLDLARHLSLAFLCCLRFPAPAWQHTAGSLPAPAWHLFRTCSNPGPRPTGARTCPAPAWHLSRACTLLPPDLDVARSRPRRHLSRNL